MANKAKRCPCQGETLDRFIRPALLAFLAEEDASGYRLLQRLAEMPMFKDDRPDPTGVYRCLKAMEQTGLVTGKWNLSASGPASRVFKLTAAGRTCLATWQQTILDYRDDLDFILALIRKASKNRKR